MNIETRHRHARKRRHHVVTVAVIAAATACTTQQQQPVRAPATAGDLTDHDVVRLRALDPTPAAKPSSKPKPRATRRPTPARISTATTIRRLRVTEYCYEGSPTALGKQPWIGVAAVKKASGMIPYGARLVVAGKRYVVGDREPSFGVSDVDLYAGRGPTCEREAARFGIQHLNVTIERAA